MFLVSSTLTWPLGAEFDMFVVSFALCCNRSSSNTLCPRSPVAMIRCTRTCEPTLSKLQTINANMTGRPLKKNTPLSTLLDKKAQKCGLRHTVYSVNGNEYTGEWQDNKKHGKGTEVWKKVGAIYDGEWKFGKRDGYGTYSILNAQSSEYARKYCGEWKNGKKHGFGTFFYNCSAVYEGQWSEDTRSGWGRMYYANGDIYEGEWLKDKNHGKGIVRCANGNWYEGTWRDGKKDGYGKFFYSNQGQLYEGFWLDGIAKCGTLSDFGRNEAPMPPKYPIPQLHLVDMQSVLSEAQSDFIDQL